MFRLSLSCRFLRYSSVKIRQQLLRGIAVDGKTGDPISAVLSDNNIISCNRAVELPPQDLNLYSFIKRDFDSYGSRTALIDITTGYATSYNELQENLRRFASGLVRIGFGKGDTLAIVSANGVEFVYALCAPSALGGIVTTINPASHGNEIIYQLRKSGATMIFTSIDKASEVIECARAVGISRTNVIINDMQSPVNSKDVVRLSQMLSGNDNAFPNKIEPVGTNDNLALLPFSSGTTGLPKGVMQTHGNITANVCQMSSFLPPSRRTLLTIPMYHTFGITVDVMRNLHLGQTLMPLSFFDPERFLATIEKYKIDNVNLVPPLLMFLMNHPLVKDFDLSSLNFGIFGAAPCSKHLHQRFLEKFPHIEHLYQGYGMTETGPVATLQTAGHVKVGTAGIPVPHTEIKVVDMETGETVGKQVAGEICIRGPQVMKGYYNNKEATDSTIRADNWLHSGDVGYFDDDGHLCIVDRLKELIKYKGFQVAPAELESLLGSHPMIVEAAVIGIPHKVAGELPKALVVKAPDCKLTEDEVMSFVEKNVAPHKKLRGGVTFINEIPKSPSGKILRRLLRKSFIEE